MAPERKRRQRVFTITVLVVGSVISSDRIDASVGAGSAMSRTLIQLECTVQGERVALPRAVAETSGLARGTRNPDHLWTHNDRGAEPVLYAWKPAGEPAMVAVTGAAVSDWEDLAAGPCARGHCFYIGDIGDNNGRRAEVMIYEVPEPPVQERRTEPARRLTMRYPDGAQDAEALFRLGSDLYIVTKGVHGPVRLYRYAAPFQYDGVRTLELIKPLEGQPAGRRDLVTGASASEDGRWVALRTYRTLFVYDAQQLVAPQPAREVFRFDLTPLGEPQGESVMLTNDGTVWLTTEAENRRAAPSAVRLTCRMPR